MVPFFSFGAFLNPCKLKSPETVEIGKQESFWLRQREISEEYRYVLERKAGEGQIGNMLQRPSLLMKPWSDTSTSTETQSAARGASVQRAFDSSGVVCVVVFYLSILFSQILVIASQKKSNVANGCW